MADVPSQPSSQPASADDLLDEYLGASEPEHSPKTPSKPAEPGAPEKTADEEDFDLDEAIAESKKEDEESEDTDEADDAKPDENEDKSEEEAGRFVGHDGRVKLSDGTVTTVQELIRGNLREADYTRKTQETGALHQELQTRLADYAQQEKLVALAIDIMAAALPAEPDPALLQAGEGYDPVGYTSQKLLWEHASQQLQGLMQAKEKMAEQQQVMQGTLLKRYALEQKDKLLGYHPELRDKTKLEAYHSGLVKTLSRYGKSAEDLAQVFDADIIRMVEHLGEYHKILASRRAARRKAQNAAPMAAPMSPSTRQSAQTKKARARANDWETLRKTGSHGSSGEQALDRILDDILR